MNWQGLSALCRLCDTAALQGVANERLRTGGSGAHREDAAGQGIEPLGRADLVVKPMFDADFLFVVQAEGEGSTSAGLLALRKVPALSTLRGRSSCVDRLRTVAPFVARSDPVLQCQGMRADHAHANISGRLVDR